MRYQKLDATLIEQIDYSYDVLGRRTSKTLLNAANAPETPMAASYDNANRMSSITLEPGTAQEKRYSLSYDDNGALILKQRVDSAGSPLTQSPTDTTQYSWDSRGRLSQIKHGSATPATVASYSYDHAGRRISRSIQDGANSASQVSTQYLYDGQQAIGEVRDGQLSASLVSGLGIDDAIARITSAGGTPEVKSYLTDALGSVIAQLKQDQSVEVGYAYSPYGQTLKAGTESGNTSTANATQYTGRENDGAQGGTSGGELYYYRARYYDPVLKRFISQDPIGLAGGANFYGYVGGNPVSYSDPDGLKPRPGSRNNGGNSSQRREADRAEANRIDSYRQRQAERDAFISGFTRRDEQWERTADGIGALTGAGGRFNHPSVPNSLEWLISPDRINSGQPYVPSPSIPICQRSSIR